MTRLASIFAVLLLYTGIATGDPRKNVLLLHEGSRLMPYQMIASRVLQEDLGLGPNSGVEIFEEFLDTWRLNADLPRVSNALEAKYSTIHFDIVVADGSEALNLLTKHSPGFLQGTPVVFLNVADYDAPSTLPAKITGVITHVDYAKTVRLASMLQPDLRHLYYIDAEPKTEAIKNEFFQREFKDLDKKLDVSFWENQDVESLLIKVANLPAHSAVLFDTYYIDRNGHAYIPAQVCQLVSEHSNAPVYTVYQTMIGKGPVGGVVVDFNMMGHQASKMVLNLLNGAPVSTMPVQQSMNRVAIDWNQFERFQFSEGRLPGTAAIYNREPTLWSRYRWYLMFGALIILVQAVLIVRLEIEGRRRRQSEKATQELAGRLIHEQESERKRIASELHDDVCQRLALLCFQLDTLRSEPPDSEESLVHELSAIYEETDRITSDIHQFSRQLHSAILERLGLVSALRRFCAEFGEHRKITVEFSTNGDDFTLNEEVALVLYRVGQESLMNVSKHSGATSCDVSLSFSNNRVVLEIHDSGRGFEPREMKHKVGLGLESERERLRSVSGRLVINSAPNQGTRIRAEVPLIPPAKSSTARQRGDHSDLTAIANSGDNAGL